MIEIEVPKETTFDLPEGNFALKVDNVKVFPRQTSKGMEDWVRLLFRVKVPGMEQLNPLAKRDLKLNLNPGSDLRNFLGGLLGGRFFLDNSGQKFDLETLIGMEGEGKLEHYFGKGYDKPLVVVAAVYPPHSLKLTQAIPETGGKD